jgi:phenylalanyl-tRNA synthetase alpha chain
MSLQDFLSTHDQLQAQASSDFDTASDTAVLEDARIRYLGAKKGALKDVQKKLGQIPKDDKRAAGMRLVALQCGHTMCNGSFISISRQIQVLLIHC